MSHSLSPVRFPNVFAALRELQKQGPEYDSEAQIAMQILLGKRPGLEEKYDALLLKLDRTYSRLEDQRNHWQKKAEETVLFQERKKAQSHVRALNQILTDLTWMRARNKDMIDLASKFSPSTINNQPSTV